MFLKKIRIITKNKDFTVPSQGNFDRGVNIIYSEKNNKNKTTLLRSIFKCFFSNSIVMPKQSKEFGELRFIEILANHNNEDFITKIDVINEIIISNYSGREKSYFDHASFISEIFPMIPPKKYIWTSILGTQLLLDQDYNSNNPSLWPSIYAHKSEIRLAKYWYMTKKVIKYDETYKQKLTDLNMKKKKITNDIEMIKKYENSNLTNIPELDIESINSKIKIAKINRTKYINISKKLHEINSNIYMREMGTKKLNRSSNSNFVFISAVDPETNENKIVKVDLERMLNFSKGPISEASADLNKEIKKLIDEKNILEKELNSIGSFSDYTTRLITSDFNFNNLSSEINLINKEIKHIKDLKGKWEEDYRYNRVNLKKNETILNNKIEEIKNIFTWEDSNSGSDLFILKISSFLALTKLAIWNEFPLIIDSIKEKDFSNENQKTLVNELVNISLLKKRQIIISATNPNGDVISGIRKWKID